MKKWVCPICEEVNIVKEGEVKKECKVHCSNCENNTYVSELNFETA